MDALLQRRRRIVRPHRHRPLDDDGTFVDAHGDEVNCRPVVFFAVGQGALVSMEPLVAWQQRWMDIHQPARVMLDQFLAENAHETGEHHETRIESIDEVLEGAIVIGAGGKIPVIEDVRRDVRLARPD